MTDSTGMLQFCDRAKPLIQSGYTADDNARALIVAMGMKEKEREKLVKTYINFLKDAQGPEGIWHNLKVNGQYYSYMNSEDSIGRGLLAASFAAGCGISEAEDIAWHMIKKALPKALNLSSPRAMSYVLLGLVKMVESYETTRLIPHAKQLASRIIKLYDISHGWGWHWFEDKLTYCNALLPHALFGYYTLSGDIRSLKVAQDTLDFLTDSLFKKGYLNIVGNQGWWKKQSQIPPYDQQPVDAGSIVLACLQAFIATDEHEYITKAQMAYDWYWGKNINHVPLYNAKTQGCHDAIVPDGVNLNQGAEAVISFLMSHQILGDVKGKKYGYLVPAV